MKFYITYLIVFGLSLSVSAQNWGVWGVWNGEAETVANVDTTNDLYVSTAGTIGGALDIAEPGDSIFILSGTYQEEDTIDVDNITLLAYNSNNKPIIFGGDSLNGSGWVLHTASSADTTLDTLQQDLTNTGHAETSINTLYKIVNPYADGKAQLKSYLAYLHTDVDTDLKFGLANESAGEADTLLANTITTALSASLTATAVNTINVSNGASLDSGNIWIAIIHNGSGSSVPYNASAGTIQYGFSNTPTYLNWATGSSFSATNSSHAGAGIGIVVEIITQGSGGQSYYAQAANNFTGVYFGVNRGNQVSALDSLVTTIDYYYDSAVDSIYTLDTTNVILIKRDGLIVKSDNANINNIDFELTKTAIKIDTASDVTIEGIEIEKSNLGILTRSSSDLSYKRIYLHNNLNGLNEFSSSNSSMFNSRFAFNDTNITSDSDTLKFINNTLVNHSKLANLNLSGAKNIILKNNAVYTGTGWIGEIDSSGAVDSMDYNAYGYWATPDSLFWHIGSISYGTLTSLQASSVFDQNSLDLTSAGANWNDLFGLDFSLKDTAQLINSGINYLAEDFSGVERDDTSDIGADEFKLQPPVITEFSASLLNDSTAQLTWFGERISSTTAYYGYSAASDSFAVVDTFSVTKKMQRYDGKMSIVAFNAANIAVDSANISGSIIFNHDAGDSTRIKIHYRVNGSASWDSSNVTSYFKTYVNDTTYFKVKAKNSAGYSDYSNTAVVYPHEINFTKSITGLDSGTVYDYEVSALNAVSGEYVKSVRKTFTTPASTPPVASTNLQIYVSNSLGNDANNGTVNFPIKTLSELEDRLTVYEDNDLTDTVEILLKKGDVWVESLELKNLKGTSSNPVIVKSYGSGVRPLITLRQEVPESQNTNLWVNTGGNIWALDNVNNLISSGNKPQRIWLDSVEYTLAAGVTSGDNFDGTQGITSTHRFYINSSYVLYLYSTQNPATQYSKIEMACKFSQAGLAELYTLTLNDADYVIIDGINFEGGNYSAIGLGGSDSVIIKNCNIGKYSDWAGIYGNSANVSSTDNTSDYVTLDGDTIASDFTLEQLQQFSVSSGIQYGLAIGNGATGWVVKNCFINNWCSGVFIIANTGISTSHKIYSNEFTNEMNYGYPVVFSARETYNEGKTNSYFYNNYCHDMKVGIELAASGNSIFYNIFDTYDRITNVHSPAQSGWGLQVFRPALPSPDSPTDNKVFNNTFYNMKDWGIKILSENNGVYSNNILADLGLEENNVALYDGTTTTKTFKNNLFFNSNLDASTDQMIRIPENTTNQLMTISEFNAYSGITSKVISGNMQEVGAIGDLLNTSTFKIFGASKAANASDTSSVFKTILKDVADSNGDFKDQKGNLILDNDLWFEVPNIGAVNDEQ